MPLDNLIAYPIKGVNAQDRLPITAKLWTDSHDHHVKHRQLHALAAHRPGIVYGLEVFVSSTNEQTVTIAPGVAVDENGNTIVLSGPESFTFREKGTNYLVLEYQAGYDGDSEVALGPNEKVFANFVEFRHIAVTKEPARGGQIELARVQRSDANAAIKEAANPFDPGQNELSLLYRSLSYPHCYVDGRVGEVQYLPNKDLSAWKPNRAGLVNFVREAAGHGFHLDFIGPYRLSEPDRLREPLVLYMAGREGFKELSPDELANLRALLDRGGFLVGESKGGDDAFARSFDALARALGASLQPLPAGHPLLSSHVLFPKAPGGAEILLDEKGGVLFTSADFGGTWQGEAPGKGDPREGVRQAIEFGLNVAAFADRRRRRISISALG